MNPTGSVILESIDASQRITITNDVVGDAIEFDEIALGGTDVSTRIVDIQNQPGVGSSNVESEHIADASISTDKFSLVSVSKGGTGATSFGDNEFLFAKGGEISSSSGLQDSGGIQVGSAVRLEDGPDHAEFYTVGNDLMVDINGVATNLSAMSAGSAPTIISLALVGDTLSYTLRDVDGDLRSLHIIWYSSGQSLTSSDVFFHTTGEGSSSSTPPEGAHEADLFDAINTGSSEFSWTYVNAAMNGKFVYAVAEDGPGNLSVVVGTS